MVSEPRSCYLNVLSGDGRPQFGEAGTHHLVDVFSWNFEGDERRELRRGSDDARWFDHGCAARLPK
jgi:hypothetical protein